MMKDPVLMALLILLALAFSVRAALRWFVIRRALRRHGTHHHAPLHFWRMSRELRAYKDLRAAQARDLSVYYVVVILRVFTIAVLIVAAVRALWLNSGSPD